MTWPVPVLHVLSTGRMSGAERIVQLVCRYLDRRRFFPVVVCAGDPLASLYRQEGVAVEEIAVGRVTPVTVARLREVIGRWQVGIIHAHDHRASLISWLAKGRTARLILISHLHNTNPWLRRPHPCRFLELFLRNRYHLSLACSQQVRDYFLRYNPRLQAEKIVTVRNGIELPRAEPTDPREVRRELALPERGFVFGTVGRLVPQKGIDLLLAAFRRVAAAIPDSCLLIVGAGPEEGKLRALSREFGRRVVFAGYREDVNRLFQAMDVFVLPSRWEGLPVVILEALVAQLPVVATDVGGVKEAVLPGKTGLLVPRGDVEALAEGMIRLYRDRKLAAALAAAGRKLVEERFNIVNQVRRLEEIYLKLLEGDHR